MLTLYQAEWCPYSSAVREVLTELGLDFVARQVEPEPERARSVAARARRRPTRIPVLETEDGELFRGARRDLPLPRDAAEPWEHADAHRRRFLDHADARKSDGDGPARRAVPARSSPARGRRRGARRRGGRRRPGGEPLRAPARRPPHRPRRVPASATTGSRSRTPRSTPRARAAASARGSCTGALDDARAGGASRSCRSARSSPLT